MSEIFFSVIIPTYQRLKFTRRAINTVLSQDFYNFEVIVVDDCSKDGSFEALTNRYRNEDRIRLLQNSKNLERGASRNIGMQQAHGRFITFLDSDDRWNRDHLSTLKMGIEESDAVLLATKYFMVDEEGIALENNDLMSVSGNINYRHFLKGNSLACNFCCKNIPKMFIPFQSSKDYSGFEDWVFLIQNTFNHPLYAIDKFTVEMSDHSGRSMRNNHISLINKRNAATALIMDSIELDEAEIQQLKSGTNYFNSVHAYLGDSKQDSAKYLIKSLSGGLKLNHFKQAFRLVFF